MLDMHFPHLIERDLEGHPIRYHSQEELSEDLYWLDQMGIGFEYSDVSRKDAERK